MSATSSSSERGFALLLTIWALALLAILAATVAADSDSEAVVTRNRLDVARAQAEAEAGVSLAVASLLEPDPAARWPANGQTQTIQYDDGSIAVTVQDEAGKIDVNAAPLELIGGLLDEFEISAEDRSRVLAAIRERRRTFAQAKKPDSPPALDAGSLERRRELAEAGLSVPSPFTPQRDPSVTDVNAKPFIDLSELRVIPGVTRSLYDKLAPYLTTYSDLPTVNPMTAPREVLAAIPGVSPQDLGFFLAARDQATTTGVEKPQLKTGANYLQIAELHAVTITAVATTSTGATFRRDAVVVISPLLPQRPFRILRWRRGTEASADQIAAQ